MFYKKNQKDFNYTGLYYKDFGFNLPWRHKSTKHLVRCCNVRNTCVVYHAEHRLFIKNTP